MPPTLDRLSAQLSRLSITLESAYERSRSLPTGLDNDDPDEVVEAHKELHLELHIALQGLDRARELVEVERRFRQRQPQHQESIA